VRTFEKWKAWVFIGSLVAVAAIINSTQQHRQGEKIAQEHVLAVQQNEQKARTERGVAEAVAAQRAAEERKAEEQHRAEEATAEHARFLARHLNKGLARKPGIQRVAVVASSEDREENSVVSAALTEHLKTEAVEIVPSLFRPEFVSDGLFDDVLAGANDIPTKLELTNILDVLVLARQDVKYSKNPSLENVITANMRLEVAAFSITANMKDQTWRFEVKGAGFTPTAARSLAEERLLKQIAKDTKMSLPH
jgi:hypothetical protein